MSIKWLFYMEWKFQLDLFKPYWNFCSVYHAEIFAYIFFACTFCINFRLPCKMKSRHGLSLFKITAQGWERSGKKAPLPKICRTYLTMMKLGTDISYLKEIQKIYKLPNTLLEIWLTSWNFSPRWKSPYKQPLRWNFLL